VLVLNYLRETGTINEEIELKALEYVSQGYQRLLTFEVDGGGFEWFGGTPAHNILTAYGLLEFSDMSKVYEVDPQVIARTQSYLLGQQKPDGHWEPSEGGIAEGAINNFQAQSLRFTGYVAWGLLESGQAGGAVANGLSYLRQHRSEAEDVYTLAIIANAFIASNKSDADGIAILNQLDSMKIMDDNVVHWGATEPSEMYGYGDTASMESTALIAYAMIRSGAFNETAKGAIDYLIKNKDSFGNWESTQATIWSLKAMTESVKSSTSISNALVDVLVNGAKVHTFAVTPENSDVLQQLDLSTYIAKGDNEITLSVSGESDMLYQLTGTHYAQWSMGPVEPPVGPLSIAVNYDKTTLEVDDTVTATVTITNNLVDAAADMVLVDLGIPPGFTVITSSLDPYVEAKSIQKYEVAGRQLQVYLYSVPAGEQFTFSYQLNAKFPMRGSTGTSEVYPYYNPDDAGQAPAQDMAVEDNS
jgi:uncharacterized repeat protein (TIGR01451 family)